MGELTTRKQFFKQLKKNLRFKYGKSEMQSVISDYEEIFDIELTRGQSETDICKTLGNPAVIVRNLDQEIKGDGKKQKGKAAMWKHQYIGWLYLGLMAIAPLYFINNHYRISNIYFLLLVIESVIIISVIAMLIWLQINKGYSTRLEKRSFAKLLGMHAGGLGVILVVMAFVALLPKAFTQPTWLELELENIGPFIAGVCGIGILVWFILIAGGIYLFRKESVYYMTLIGHGLGAVWVITYYLCVLGRLDELAGYQRQLGIVMILYLETLAAVAVVGLFAKWKGMR